MNFNKNDLIDAVLRRFYDTFRCTLDTADFVPEKYNDKICAYIFKNMKKAFRQIDKNDRVYRNARKKLEERLRVAAHTNAGSTDRARSTVSFNGVNDRSEQAALLNRVNDEPPESPETPEGSEPPNTRSSAAGNTDTAE